MNADETAEADRAVGVYLSPTMVWAVQCCGTDDESPEKNNSQPSDQLGRPCCTENTTRVS